MAPGEVGWLRHCAEWLDHLEHQTFPPAANLRPECDHPDRCHVVVNLARVRDILQRIAFDVEELARARRIEDLNVSAVAQPSVKVICGDPDAAVDPWPARP